MQGEYENQIIKGITQWVNAGNYAYYTFTVNESKKVRISFEWSSTGNHTVSNVMLVEGSTPPESYIPHGYKLPLIVTSGAESKTADVYIGDSKLGAEEYVDYEEQKVYRRGENLTDWNKTYHYGVGVNLNQDSATITTSSAATLYPCLQFSANASGGPDSLGLVPGKKYIATYTIIT